MKEKKRLFAKLKRIFATILTVALIVTNANIPVLAYDSTDDTMAVENNSDEQSTSTVPANESEGNFASETSEKTVSDIHIETAAARIQYAIGVDTGIDYTGLEVEVKYSDGSSESVYNGDTVTESGQAVSYDSSSIDWEKQESRQEQVTVTSGDVSSAFVVELQMADTNSINETENHQDDGKEIASEQLRKIREMQLVSPPNITNYPVGHYWGSSYDGMRVKVIFDNDDSEEIKPFDPLQDGRYVSWYDNIDFGLVGTYHITASCDEISVSADIKVLEEVEYLKTIPPLNQGDNLALSFSEGITQYRFTAPAAGDYNILFNYDASIDSYVQLKTLDEDYIESTSYWDDNTLEVRFSLKKNQTCIIDINTSSACTANITVERLKSIQQLEVVSPPDILKYPVGYVDGISFSGMIVKVIFDDNSFEELNPWENLSDGRYINWDSSEIDFDTAGTYNAKVKYNEISTSVDIQVLNKDDYIHNFSELIFGSNNDLALAQGVNNFVFTAPESKLYRINFFYDMSVNSSISVRELDGSYIDSSFSWESSETHLTTSLEQGKSYLIGIDTEAACNADISFETLEEITEIQVISPPKIQVYPVGYTNYCNYDGIRLKVSYSSGDSEELDIYDSTSDGRHLSLDSNIDFRTPGTYEITISSGNCSTSTPVEVLNEDDYISRFDHLTADRNPAISLSEGSNKFAFSVPESGNYQINFLLNTSVDDLNIEITEITGSSLLYNYFGSTDTARVTQHFEKDKAYIIDIISSESCTADINFKKLDEITDLQLISPPDITKYPVGYTDYSIYDGMRVKALLENGTSEEVSIDTSLSDGRDLSWSNDIDFSKIGTYHVIVSYRDLRVTADIEVIEEEEYLKDFDQLTLDGSNSFSLTAGRKNFVFTPPEAGHYRIILNYNTPVYSEACLTSVDGTYIDSVSSMYITSLSFTGSLRKGIPYILSIYNDKDTTVSFTFEKLQEIKELQLVSPPKNTSYPVGYSDNYSYDGMRVKVTFNDGTSEIIGPHESLSDGRYFQWSDDIDFSTIGTYHITMSFESDNISVSAEVKVLSQEDYIQSLPTLQLEKPISLSIPEGDILYKTTVPITGRYFFTNTKLLDDSAYTTMYISTANGESVTTQNTSFFNNTASTEATLEGGETYILRFSSHSDTYTLFNSYLVTDQVSKLEILSTPEQREYPPSFDGSSLSLNLTGLKLQITYKNGDTEILTDIDTPTKDGRFLSCTHDIYSMQAGIYPVTLSLGDVNTSFDIELLDGNDYLSSLDTLELDKEKSHFFENIGDSLTLKYTPEETEEYILTEVNENSAFNSSNIRITATDGSQIQNNYNSSALADVILEAGKTYIFDLTSHNTGISRYLLSIPSAVTSLELVSEPITTTLLTSSDYSLYTFSKGLMAKVTYADGKAETLSIDQADHFGHCLNIDYSLIQRFTPGVYKVFVEMGGQTDSFDVSVIDGNTYFKDTSTFTMPSVQNHVAPGERKTYDYIPDESGDYVFSHSSMTNYAAVSLNIYDSNYNELPKIFILNSYFPTEGVVTSYTVHLEKGTKYYLSIENQQADTDLAYTLSLTKEKDVASIKMSHIPDNTTRVVGADFATFYPGDALVEAVYKDGSSKTLSTNQYSINVNYNPFAAGTYKQEVTSSDQSTSFNIEVVAPKDYPDTAPLILNKFTEFTYHGNNPIYLYSFKPEKSKNYYINLVSSDISKKYFRLLSEDGNVLDTMTSQNSTWEVSLTENVQYYIAVYTSSLTYPEHEGISITDQKISVSSDYEYYTYTSDEIRPSLTVTLNGKALKQNTDYTITYHNNINAGLAYAEISPAGKQTFAIARYFYSIYSIDIHNAAIAEIKDQPYTGTEVCPKPTVTYKNKELKEGVDYKLIYNNNINKGTAQVSILGIGNFHYSITKNFEIISANKIDYVLNDGTNNPENPVFYDTADVSLKNPTRKGYSFSGWYTDKDFKTKITTIKGSTDKDYTLYAKWTKITVGKVSGLEASASGTTTATAKWTALKGANGYQVDYAANSSFTSSKTSTNTDKTSVSISKLPSGATRYIRVRAYVLDSAGEKVYGSYSTSVTFKLKPAAPKITKLAGGAGKITITWEDVSGESGYQVYMATSQNGTYSKIASPLVNATSYTATSLKSASTYYFKVRAYNKSATATQYSSFSAVSYAPTSPSAPAISKITGGTKAVTLNWKDVSGENGYQIYMSTSQNGTYSKVATAKANATSYTVKDLSAAKTYYFKIRSYRTVNSVTAYSSFSSIKSAATRTATPAISSVTGGSGKATVKWKAITGASGYVVYMATSSGGTYKNIGSVKSSTTSLTKTGLSAAKNYYFKVRAYRSAGGANVYSSYSSYKWCGTATATTSITKITAGAKKVSLQWKNVSGESGYQVYMATSKNGTYSKVATPKTNATSYTKSGLTKGKTYYFKVRTYRKVNGQTVYSSFSAVKSAKAK